MREQAAQYEAEMKRVQLLTAQLQRELDREMTATQRRTDRLTSSAVTRSPPDAATAPTDHHMGPDPVHEGDGIPDVVESRSQSTSLVHTVVCLVTAKEPHAYNIKFDGSADEFFNW